MFVNRFNCCISIAHRGVQFDRVSKTKYNPTIKRIVCRSVIFLDDKFDKKNNTQKMKAKVNSFVWDEYRALEIIFQFDSTFSLLCECEWACLTGPREAII
jgi:hypothetical protein